MVINVNITCLLALASVYLAVATSLPSTSSTKPVEVFLIYNLAYPFLTILLAVAIQVHPSSDELLLDTFLICQVLEAKIEKCSEEEETNLKMKEKEREKMIFSLVFAAAHSADTDGGDGEEEGGKTEAKLNMNPGPLRKKMIQCRILMKMAQVVNPLVYALFCCFYFLYFVYFFDP